jgi:hypothetical protein
MVEAWRTRTVEYSTCKVEPPRPRAHIKQEVPTVYLKLQLQWPSSLLSDGIIRNEVGTPTLQVSLYDTY